MEGCSIELGGNITLTGFQDRDYAELIVVKKVVGRYARHLSDHVPGFSSLTVHLKQVHQKIHHIDVKADIDGKIYNAHAEDRNLFFSLDSAFKKLVSQFQ